MTEWIIDQRRLVLVAVLVGGTAVGVSAGAPCGITAAVCALSAACLWWWVTPSVARHLIRLECRLHHARVSAPPTRSDTRRAICASVVVVVTQFGVNDLLAWWAPDGPPTVALAQSVTWVAFTAVAVLVASAVRAWRTQHPMAIPGDVA